MDNTITDIKQLPSNNFSDALKKLDYMERYLEEYKIYYDVDKMFEDILDEEG